MNFFGSFIFKKYFLKLNILIWKNKFLVSISVKILFLDKILIYFCIIFKENHDESITVITYRTTGF